MTATALESLEPLAVWDTHRGQGPWRAVSDEERRIDLMIEAYEWARPHIERTADTFRVEFYLLDAPFAVIYRHRRGQGARLAWNPETRRPYEEEPAVVPLAELPPEHLLRGRSHG
ncbi:MAG TPA: hypothetical protein VGH53_02550 [Streptosporangiaceae bacterium]